MIPVDATTEICASSRSSKGVVSMTIKQKSLADFKAAHDKNFIVPEKIKAGLAKLGNDGWEYEVEFGKMAGVGTNDIAKFREQFGEYVLLVKSEKRERRVWAGSKALANKMREMI